MAKITAPKIVIEEPLPDRLSATYPPRPSQSTPLSTVSSEKVEGAFAKLVRTVQFIKKWSKRTEETQQGRDEFLNRFNLGGPNIDDAFIYSGTPDNSKEDREKRHWVAIKSNRLKRSLFFNPMNANLHRWLTVITLAVLYNLFVIIARQTFQQMQDTSWKLAIWLMLDYIADTIYILDMIVQSRTGYLERGLLVTDSRKMALHYLKSWAFRIDIVSIVPLDWLYIIPAIGPTNTAVRLNRIIRMPRIIKFFNRIESRSNVPNFVRLCTLMVYISLTIHWNACFYFLISMSIGFGNDQWVYPAIEGENATDGEYAQLSRKYLVSLYWSTLTLTTIGEVPGPVTEGEFVFVIFDFLVGVFLFATIVGMVGEIITNINAGRSNFQAKLDNIKQYMTYRNVGKHLQTRVIKWFDYLWTHNQSLDEQAILTSLPDKLHAEIAIHVHFETLRRVKIFEECEAGLLEELVLKLRPQVFSPGDYVCRKGDIGKEMYIIKHGKLEVIGEHDEVIATLTDGSYFGEISVLNLSGSGNRRTANVKSVGYSDLFCLSKSDLLEVLMEYPDAKLMLEDRGRRTLMRDGTLDDSTINAPRSITMGNTLERRVEDISEKLENLETRFTRLLGEYNTAQMKLKQRIHALECEAKKNVKN